MVMTSSSSAATAEAGVVGELVYLSVSGLDLADVGDDVRGLVVVDPDGHRLGEVGDLVIDTVDRRARFLSVESGGILGLATTERLVPVEVVVKVDERVRVDRSYEEVATLPQPEGSFALIYARYGVMPYWRTAGGAPYFHAR